MAARLVSLNGEIAGQHFLLCMDQYVGLRHCSDSEIVFPSSKLRVSRRHLRITFDDGVFVMHDCGSMAGSFCNGVQVESHPLAHGDVLRLGDAEFRFELVEP